MTVLEIGCGKGEFLVALCERAGCNGIGLDPGYRPERTQSTASRASGSFATSTGRATRTCRRTTCAAATRSSTSRPVRDFVTLVRETIGDRRHVNVFFELPDMERVLEHGAFWDIYYEHCTYFTRGSLARLFRETGLRRARAVQGLWRAVSDAGSAARARADRGAPAAGERPRAHRPAGRRFPAAGRGAIAELQDIVTRRAARARRSRSGARARSASR